MIINVWMFEKDELLAPLRDCGFVLERYERIQVEDPLWEAFRETNDLDQYAEELMNFYRSVSEGLIASQIAPERRESAVEALYSHMTATLKELCGSKSALVDFACHALCLRRDYALRGPSSHP